MRRVLIVGIALLLAGCGGADNSSSSDLNPLGPKVKDYYGTVTDPAFLIQQACGETAVKAFASRNLGEGWTDAWIVECADNSMHYVRDPS